MPPLRANIHLYSSAGLRKMHGCKYQISPRQCSVIWALSMLVIAESSLKIYIAPLPPILLEDIIGNPKTPKIQITYSNPEGVLLSQETDLYNSNQFSADAHFYKQLQKSVLRTHSVGFQLPQRSQQYLPSQRAVCEFSAEGRGGCRLHTFDAQRRVQPGQARAGESQPIFLGAPGRAAAHL